MHCSDRLELPSGFWIRVKPSPLVVTLALNMASAAKKAFHSGRFEEAGAKYTKAARYLEQSASLYDDDPEMFMWTQEKLRECRRLAENLGGSTSAGQELPESSQYLLRLH
jgi:hypothetical protein